jgi:hypothetical protein
MYSPRYEISDGGRNEAGYTQEYLDCTVRALASALNIPYTQAHIMLSQYGRKDGQTLHPSFAVFMSKVYPNIPHQSFPRGQRHRVHTLLETYKYDKVIFHIAHHVFAVVDNTVLDLYYPTSNKNCIVTDIWDFTDYTKKL